MADEGTYVALRNAGNYYNNHYAFKIILFMESSKLN